MNKIDRKKNGLKMDEATIDIKTGCRTLHVIIMHEGGNPRMVKLNIGKQGDCILSALNAVAGLVTLCLEYEVPVDDIIESLKNYHCKRITKDKGKTIWSCADALSDALKRFKKEFKEVGE